ncbi:MAG TPA: c-type cytochrome [Gemmatimonadaceae bacterium]|nr:c-type cytochrome [Gemmatimonadaceae bacterium]
MEVLYDVRTRSCLCVRQAFSRIALLGLMAACGDAPREMPADTAIAPPGVGDTLSDTARFAGADTTRDSANASTPVSDVSFVLLADSAAGDSIFNRSGTCFTCHGQYGGGLTSLGPNLRDSVWLHADGSYRSIFRVITQGVAVPKASPIGMPSFEGRLSEMQRRQVAAYVFSLSHPGSVATDTTTARTDSLSPFLIPVPANPPR